MTSITIKGINEGFHGSKTLWESVKGSEVYWKELRDFLNKKEM